MLFTLPISCANLTPRLPNPLPIWFLAPSPRAERGKGVRFAS